QWYSTRPRARKSKRSLAFWPTSQTTDCLTETETVACSAIARTVASSSREKGGNILRVSAMRSGMTLLMMWDDLFRLTHSGAMGNGKNEGNGANAFLGSAVQLQSGAQAHESTTTAPGE